MTSAAANATTTTDTTIVEVGGIYSTGNWVEELNNVESMLMQSIELKDTVALDLKLKVVGSEWLLESIYFCCEKRNSLEGFHIRMELAYMDDVELETLKKKKQEHVERILELLRNPNLKVLTNNSAQTMMYMGFHHVRCYVEMAIHELWREMKMKTDKEEKEASFDLVKNCLRKLLTQHDCDWIPIPNFLGKSMKDVAEKEEMLLDYGEGNLSIRGMKRFRRVFGWKIMYFVLKRRLTGYWEESVQMSRRLKHHNQHDGDVEWIPGTTLLDGDLSILKLERKTDMGKDMSVYFYEGMDKMKGEVKVKVMKGKFGRGEKGQLLEKERRERKAENKWDEGIALMRLAMFYKTVHASEGEDEGCGLKLEKWNLYGSKERVATCKFFPDLIWSGGLCEDEITGVYCNMTVIKHTEEKYTTLGELLNCGKFKINRRQAALVTYKYLEALRCLSFNGILYNVVDPTTLALKGSIKQIVKAFKEEQTWFWKNSSIVVESDEDIKKWYENRKYDEWLRTSMVFLPEVYLPSFENCAIINDLKSGSTSKKYVVVSNPSYCPVEEWSSMKSSIQNDMESLIYVMLTLPCHNEPWLMKESWKNFSCDIGEEAEKCEYESEIMTVFPPDEMDLMDDALAIAKDKRIGNCSGGEASGIITGTTLDDPDMYRNFVLKYKRRYIFGITDRYRHRTEEEYWQFLPCFSPAGKETEWWNDREYAMEDAVLFPSRKTAFPTYNMMGLLSATRVSSNDFFSIQKQKMKKMIWKLGHCLLMK